ncbi:DUF2793 domain-containing protein [Qipengyuania sp. XHP0207]|uniref:DUF2793 domain-containing protein n=1 Tax=Qipengyuania sp. XHP0207 TaxID=3038078 RepID=UPI00241DE0AE|nr:DUF2793 domain-containing protein [Qipengyuania sp. XHP0207]MDG5748238.1 DUF2793 domain-containing protein [Qipengyuania sp. XHP0207]
MTQPIEFNAKSPRHAMPYLVPGQVQKELFVNESIALLDMLLHPVVQGEAASAPAAPVPGECWIVAPGASGDWADMDGAIAGWDGAQWTFAQPVVGLAAYEIASASIRIYLSDWSRPQSLSEPSGGSVVDTQARSAINAILAALRGAAVIA